MFFCYIGYGILLFLFNSIRALFIPRRAMSNAVEWLPVTLVVAAYNEEAVLEQKLVNTLAIDYPPEKLHIIFITDGSSDDSVNIIQRYPSVTLLHQEERKGKSAAIQRAMQHVHTPVVIFSDANTILNKECIRKMVIHYQNPETGAVAGEKMILTGDHASAVGEAEGLYWQYESFMKKQDALFHTVIGAAGELYSIRTGLFKGLEADLLLDDFIISMQVCLQGFKIAYEPGAYASEAPSISRSPLTWFRSRTPWQARPGSRSKGFQF